MSCQTKKAVFVGYAQEVAAMRGFSEVARRKVGRGRVERMLVPGYRGVGVQLVARSGDTSDSHAHEEGRKPLRSAPPHIPRLFQPRRWREA